MNKEVNKELMEDVLTELLHTALTCPEHIREPITTICEGVADLLSDDAVERAKDFAKYRAHNVTKVMLEKN